ncbi:MAG: hypothetical protein Q8L81_18585 [Bacteroidota bacterium]|nr:hypothetical protein [Bacteroidota bacterium]
MKHFLLYTLTLFICCNVFCQTTLSKDSVLHNYKRNSLFLEVGGQGGFYSIGYDRILEINGKIRHTSSIGLSYLFFGVGSKTNLRPQIFSLPYSNNIVFKNGFELGIGATILLYTETRTSYYHGGSSTNTDINPYLFAVPRIGYRYQKNTGGVFFRAALTPLIKLISGDPSFYRVLPWGGISIGKSF